MFEGAVGMGSGGEWAAAGGCWWFGASGSCAVVRRGAGSYVGARGRTSGRAVVPCDAGSYVRRAPGYDRAHLSTTTRSRVRPRGWLLRRHGAVRTIRCLLVRPGPREDRPIPIVSVRPLARSSRLRALATDPDTRAPGRPAPGGRRAPGRARETTGGRERSPRNRQPSSRRPTSARRARSIAYAPPTTSGSTKNRNRAPRTVPRPAHGPDGRVPPAHSSGHFSPLPRSASLGRILYELFLCNFRRRP